MPFKCSRCGVELPNGWVGPCWNCGSLDIVSSLGEAYRNVFTKIIGPENSGSLVVATHAVSTMSGAYSNASANLGNLKAIGTPEKYLKPLEDDIRRLYADKIEAEKKVEALTKSSPKELDQFAERVIKKLEEHTSAIRLDVQAVGLKVDGTAQMIKRLSQQVAKKEDVEEVEKLVLQNREIFIDQLKRSKNELIKTLNKQIGKKVNQKEKATLWEILEGLSVLGGAVQFAEYVKKLFDFLNEKKILHIVLPIIVKFIFGGVA